MLFFFFSNSLNKKGEDFLLLSKQWQPQSKTWQVFIGGHYFRPQEVHFQAYSRLEFKTNKITKGGPNTKFTLFTLRDISDTTEHFVNYLVMWSEIIHLINWLIFCRNPWIYFLRLQTFSKWGSLNLKFEAILYWTVYATYNIVKDRLNTRSIDGS